MYGRPVCIKQIDPIRAGLQHVVRIAERYALGATRRIGLKGSNLLFSAVRNSGEMQGVADGDRRPGKCVVDLLVKSDLDVLPVASADAVRDQQRPQIPVAGHPLGLNLLFEFELSRPDIERCSGQGRSRRRIGLMYDGFGGGVLMRHLDVDHGCFRVDPAQGEGYGGGVENVSRRRFDLDERISSVPAAERQPIDTGHTTFVGGVELDRRALGHIDGATRVQDVFHGYHDKARAFDCVSLLAPWAGVIGAALND